MFDIEVINHFLVQSRWKRIICHGHKGLVGALCMTSINAISLASHCDDVLLGEELLLLRPWQMPLAIQVWDSDVLDQSPAVLPG